MSEQLSQDILKAIEQHLPQALGDVLKKRITQVELLESQLKRLEIDNESLRTIIGAQNSTVEEAQAVVKDNRVAAAELGKMKAELSDKLRDAKVAELEYKLKAEIENRDFARNVALGLVRNIEFRKTVMDSEMTNVPYTAPGGYASTMQVNNTKSLTETQQQV